MNTSRTGHRSHQLGALASVARDLAAQASGARTDDLTRLAPPTPRRVVTCSSVDAVPPAVHNLGRLVAGTDPEQLGLPAIVGAVTALGRVAHTVHAALRAAIPAAAADPRLADHLTAAADATTAHRDRLVAAERHLRRMATPHPGDHATRVQAGQLAGDGCRHIADAARHTTPADVAVGLLGYPAAAAATTDAVGDATGALGRTGLLFVRATTEVSNLGWDPARSTTAVGDAVCELRAAAHAARTAPPPVTTLPLPPPSPVTDLRLALARQRLAARPGRVGAHGPGTRR
jgi:hypothetical protein